MKNLLRNLFIAVFMTFFLSSCFNTRIMVGDITATAPVQEVNKEWNHHLIYGLVPLDNANMNVKDYLPEGTEAYVVRTNRNFLQYLVSGLTFGIYTPTQTKYYTPIK